jgi:hypothetical protein
MTDKPDLTAPRLRVSLDDGTTLEVQTLNPDLIRFDLTRVKHGWPDAQKAPFVWLTFLAWAALRREHQLADDVTWEQFSNERCVNVQTLDDDREEGDRVGSPFEAGAEPD